MTSQVITRIWHGRTKAEHADEYLQFLIDTGVADYKSVREISMSRSGGGSMETFVISGR
jgi:hypothetical protein